MSGMSKMKTKRTGKTRKGKGQPKDEAFDPFITDAPFCLCNQVSSTDKVESFLIFPRTWSKKTIFCFDVYVKTGLDKTNGI